MSERKEALQELLAKVEAGKWNPYATKLPEGIPDICKAYNGSLDAAKALHDDVLAGWMFAFGARGEGVFEAMLAEDEDAEQYYAVSANPGRAWLTVIIKALIAQEGE